MTFWRVNKYEFTADLVVYLKANAYNQTTDKPLRSDTSAGVKC